MSSHLTKISPRLIADSKGLNVYIFSCAANKITDLADRLSTKPKEMPHLTGQHHSQQDLKNRVW
jgi:hypothetical protein